MKFFLLFAIFSLTVAVPLKPLNKSISESVTKPSPAPRISTPSKPSPSFNSTTAVPITFLTTESSIVINQNFTDVNHINETSTSTTNVFLNTTTEEPIVNQISTINLEEITTAMKEKQIIEETEGSSDESSTSLPETTTVETPTSSESVSDTTIFETLSTDAIIQTTTVSNISHIAETDYDTTEFIETSTTTVSEPTTSETLSTTTIIETTRSVNNSYFAETEDETTESIETTTFDLEEVVKHEVEQVFSAFVFTSIFLIISVVFRLKRSRKLRGGYSPAMEERNSTATYSLHTEFIFKDERLI